MVARAVVLLHGVWMPGAIMSYIKRRMTDEDNLDCRSFSYPSVRASLDENADLLFRFVKTLNVETVDLVGHSLGGVVALRMLALHEDAPPGRVVCLGSPLLGSAAAGVLNRHPFGAFILGNSLPVATVTEPAAAWAESVVQQREVGVIAGSEAAGVGRWFAKFEEPNDGTVAVSETRLPGIRDHLVLDVSHTGMVFSAAVSDQVAAFLAREEFLRET